MSQEDLKVEGAGQATTGYCPSFYRTPWPSAHWPTAIEPERFVLNLFQPAGACARICPSAFIRSSFLQDALAKRTLEHAVQFGCVLLNQMLLQVAAN